MKKNKGFSMVELIIVIAIMAILAGALAPALIKYINKSRISSDIQTANTIATAIQTGLSDEQGFDCAANASTPADVSNIFNSSGNAFQKAVASTIGGKSAPTTKAGKCLKKKPLDSGKSFKYILDKEGNKVEIYAADGKHKLYPETSPCLTNEDGTCANP